tara:strand:- start:1059 stop:1337 length:279 start_codon:yes stop_codon:yes gene_type:complete
MLVLLEPTSLHLHHSVDEKERGNHLALLAAATGEIAPCDRGCAQRARCFNRHIACRPFWSWVQWGGKVMPRDDEPPLRAIYRRLFPDDEQQS